MLAGKIDFQCSGTVINSRYILTSAECASCNLDGVRIGEHNSNRTVDCNKNNSPICALGVQVKCILILI